MQNDNGLPVTQPPTDRGAAKAMRFVWLSSAFALCAAAIALTIAMIAVVLPAEARREEARNSVEQTHRVVIAIDDMLARATDAETGQRGFLLTSDIRFLEPYDSGTQDIWHQFSVIQSLVSDNPSQQSRLTILHGVLLARLAELARTIDLARNGNYEAAIDVVRSGLGKSLMDKVRVTAAGMVAEENLLLLTRRTELEKTQQASIVIFFTLVIFGILGILTSGGAATWAVLAARTKRRSAVTAAEHLRLQNLLDLAPIMVRDFDGIVRFWSEGCHRLYGWTAEQAIGRSAHEMLQTVFPVSRHEIDADLLRKREWSGELHCCTQDGTRVTILAHKVLEENVDGRILGVVETVSDVTELRRIEADLRTSEARENLFIENAPAAIAMFDDAMCYLAVSRRFVHDYHLDMQSRATLIGRSHYELFPEISDHWRAIHSRVLAGETLSSEAEPFPRADGRIDWVRWEMVPWRHADGAIGGALLFSEDMTARKESETAMRDSEARLRLVQQVGGIAYTDRTLPEAAALVSAEFADIYGLPPAQKRILLADIIAMIHPDDRDRIAAVTPDTLARDGMLATEFRICRPDGTVRWVSLRTEAFLGPTGLPNRIISAQQDITEIVAAREVLAARHDELERSNADLEEFAYAISHDLKAPLRAIANLAQWIGEDMKETANPETTGNLELLQGRVVKMQMLLEGLLQYSRVGQMDKTTEDVAVADLVADIIAMQAVPPGFVVTYEGEIATLRTQRVALQVVLENLVGNSLKHHDRTQGCIIISTRLVDGVAEFRVSDDGPGIPDQFHQRIFRIFQTLANRDDPQASGIGLAIVKRKVESHGGRIWVESVPPVRGTTFVFTWKETMS
jgi:PAS domain S-box-containing protein